MNNPYYQVPSKLGLPILEALGVEIDGDCIETIEHMESDCGWDYCHCQIIRYAWRLGVKTDDITSDCAKIVDYIDRAISRQSVITAQLQAARGSVCYLKIRAAILNA